MKDKPEQSFVYILSDFYGDKLILNDYAVNEEGLKKLLIKGAKSDNGHNVIEESIVINWADGVIHYKSKSFDGELVDGKYNFIKLKNIDGGTPELKNDCPVCGYPKLKMHGEDFERCHGCEWTSKKIEL